MITKQELIDKGLTLIPISDIEIVKDIDKTIGYDFTVEDNYTFCTHDGVYVQDCMAVYIPVTKEGEADIINNIAVDKNLLSQTNRKSIISPSQDIILGIYSVTSPSNPINSINKEFTDIETIPIKYRNKDGSYIEIKLGEYIFNSCLPDNFSIIIGSVNKKRLINIINKLTLEYSSDIVIDTLDKIKTLGFTEATVMGYSISIEDLRSIGLKELNDRFNNNIKDNFQLLNSNEVLDEMKKLPIGIYIDSGSRGSWSQLKQLVFSRGYVSDYTGKIRNTLIKNSLVNGLTPEEFFDSCWGVRKGLLDTALSTGISGYITRQLIYSNVSCELDPVLDDCGTTDYYYLYIKDKKMANLVLWRYYVDDDNNLKYISLKNNSHLDLIGKTIKLRSPIYCKSEKICHKCYGNLKNILHSFQIGIIAAGCISEPITQLVLRSFHTSGVAQIKDINHIENTSDIISGLSLINKLLHKPHQMIDSNSLTKTEDMVMKLYDIFNPYSDILLVHYEIIISTMMFYNDILWRLCEDRNKKEYKFLSILQIPSKTSWLLSTAFSNVKSNIMNAIINDKHDKSNAITQLFRLG